MFVAGSAITEQIQQYSLTEKHEKHRFGGVAISKNMNKIKTEIIAFNILYVEM